MSGLTVVSALAAAWWILAVGLFVATTLGALLQPLRRRRLRPPVDLPPLSLILPVKLVNPGFERAQASVFDQDYPAYEILVGSAETESRALDIMRDLAAAKGHAIRVLHSPTKAAVSPKLNTMTEPFAQAQHDLVMTKDSNITFAADTMRTMLTSLTPGVGLVTAVPIATRSRSIAGVIEAILINRDARLLLTAATLGKGFGVGKVMLFRRSQLEQAGGFDAVGHTIAEDSAFAKAFETIGLATIFGATVDQEIGFRMLKDVYDRQARWAVIRRTEEPVTYPLEPLTSPLLAAGAGALAAPMVNLGSATAFFATLGTWFALELALAAIKRWEISIWHPIAFFGRDLVQLVAWVAAWTTQSVTWAGGKQAVRAALSRDAKTGR